ncbi:hypothetical protein BDN70DRAFT_819420 [Pholiota conissans]|uniref:Nucleosome assembly protein n=1 Tax=Pholiota conissans TaxID=109636 RepID=A0A9P5YM91_9AGAR|nr:hypothetical protein BDN70DRAFT_819420 [Pholiota conissans]
MTTYKGFCRNDEIVDNYCLSHRYDRIPVCRARVFAQCVAHKKYILRYDKLSLDEKRSIQGMRGIEENITVLQKEYALAAFDLERKWSAKFMDAYERRFNILSGAAAPTREEIAAGEEKSQRLELSYKALLPALKGEAKPASVEGFWLNAISNSHIGSYIVKTDVPALQHLTNIILSYPSKAEGELPAFALDFHFSENDFFKNTKLRLTFYFKEDVNAAGKLQHSHVTTDKVDWKPEKNLVQMAESGDEDNDSFFSLFEPSSSITTPAKSNIKENFRASLVRDMALDNAFDFGLELKRLVLPNAVDYFLKVANENDDDGDDGLKDNEWDTSSVGGSCDSDY